MFLHVFADTLGSVDVILSSLLIKWYGCTWSDLLCSIIISLITLIGALPRLIKCTSIIVLQRTLDKLEKNLTVFENEVQFTRVSFTFRQVNKKGNL